eukprot:TRINITY_DN22113_c0_g2_i1.p1 TRINITY_DN22113_c0_g2~~TRINITY_DN22113_c0_g2_i1.p1  ORF type:complete len:167 (-),score=31.35 TRINITY_DN22113_c0_g2_i1:14-514(-)
MTVGELFASFLFRFSIILRILLQEGFTEWRISVWSGKWVWGPGIKNYQIQIEDPFDYNDNCGRTIGRVNELESQMEQITKVFVKSWGLIRNLNSLNKVERAMLTLFRKQNPANGFLSHRANFEEINQVVKFGHDLDLAQTYKKLITMYIIGKNNFLVKAKKNGTES